MKKHQILSFLFLLSAFSFETFAIPNLQQDIDSLDYYIAHKNTFDSIQQKRIAQIYGQLHALNRKKDVSDEAYFDVYDHLFNEYQSYIYDSANVYADKLYDVAIRLDNQDKIVYAQVKKGFVYLSAGLFKECSDLFENLNVNTCSDSVKIDFYITYARLYYDLADYNNNELKNRYKHLGTVYTDKALTLIPLSDTASYWGNVALKNMKSDNYQLAIEQFKKSLSGTGNSEHAHAIVSSSIAYLYELQGNAEQAKHYMIYAAISDLKSSTKEAVALRNLAQMLYQDGDISHAAAYIRLALNDAQFYNARHRQLEISQILPIIEQEQMNMENKQKNRIFKLSLVAYCFLVVLLALLFVLLNRLKALSRAKKTIQNINDKLLESNRIKEETIGALFSWQSDYINQLDSYQKYVRKKAAEHKYEDLQTVPGTMNALKKRNELYTRFDKMVLNIFPHFVEEFNALLKDDEQIVLKKDELLNIDLRIYALIRLGMTDNEKIAEALDYSVNTIYTYKTKNRNRSKYSASEFNKRVMEIKSFSSEN